MRTMLNSQMFGMVPHPYVSVGARHHACANRCWLGAVRPRGHGEVPLNHRALRWMTLVDPGALLAVGGFEPPTATHPISEDKTAWGKLLTYRAGKIRSGIGRNSSVGKSVGTEIPTSLVRAPPNPKLLFGKNWPFSNYSPSGVRRRGIALRWSASHSGKLKYWTVIKYSLGGCDASWSSFCAGGFGLLTVCWTDVGGYNTTTGVSHVVWTRSGIRTVSRLVVGSRLAWDCSLVCYPHPEINTN